MKLVNIEIIKDELERLIRNYRFYSSTDAKYRYEAYKELSEWLDGLNITDVDDIEREVKEDAGGYPYIDATELYDYDNDKPLAKAGDKVKVVFIKDKRYETTKMV